MQLIRGVRGGGIRGGGGVVPAGFAGRAGRRGGPAVLLTFEPLPREYLVPDNPPARLTSLRERWRILSDSSIDYLWLFTSAETLRTLTPEASARLLADKLRARLVVVGHDFRFARRGEATAAVLAAA